MKKSVLTIALAVATALALSQSTAVAKSSKGHTAKTTSAKTHHKKHMHKACSYGRRSVTSIAGRRHHLVPPTLRDP